MVESGLNVAGKKISKAQKGRAKSDETKKKLSEANLGKSIPEETRLKISESLKGCEPWNKGKKTGPLSEETKRKISESNKGVKSAMWGKKFNKHKLLWVTPGGETVMMSRGCASRWHPDWKLKEEEVCCV